MDKNKLKTAFKKVKSDIEKLNRDLENVKKIRDKDFLNVQKKVDDEMTKVFELLNEKINLEIANLKLELEQRFLDFDKKLEKIAKLETTKGNKKELLDKILDDIEEINLDEINKTKKNKTTKKKTTKKSTTKKNEEILSSENMNAIKKDFFVDKDFEDIKKEVKGKKK